jgi:galactokinase
VSGAWRWFVPGRLEVFGKHTDYAGGRSLVAAVPCGITVSAVATDDGCVSIEDVATGQQAVLSATGRGDCYGWRRYVATVIRRLSSNFPGATLSTRLEISSDLPRAAGISSSSALVISVAEALIARSRIEQTEQWQHNVRTLEDRAAYFGCIENGASFGSLAGDEGVGTHGGSEDHAAIVISHAGHLQAFSFAPLQLMRRVSMPAGWTFAVASTGVRARKTGDAREAYNTAALLARLVAEAWRARCPHDPRTLGQLAREHVNFSDLSLTPELQRRLDHFLAEDARASEAADAFARTDVAAIGTLAERSQHDAEHLLGNQVKETTELVDLARAQGAAAACGFGAGWGGSVWALVPTAEAAPFLDAWLRAYRERHPYLPFEGFVSPPSAGLRRI